MVEARTGDLEVTAADIVNSLVINQESTVGVLNSAVRGQDGVVGLHDGGRDTRRRVDGELELRLLAIFGGKLLQQERTKSRPRATAEGLKDQEPLKRGAVVWSECVSLRSIWSVGL